MIYGMVRVSTQKQNIQRQIRNILSEYPTAIIIKEVHTRTTFQGRKEWEKLMKKIKSGDTIVFDSVSRMSGNVEEGVNAYEELYQKGVELIFLKEPHINTSTYKKALENTIELTGTSVDFILEGVNKYLMTLAKEQIRLAFLQSAKEVEDIRSRTKEGVQNARLAGKQIGNVKGSKLTTKKSIESKAKILKYSKDFGGALNDTDCIQLLGICRNSFYKYKSELKEG